MRPLLAAVLALLLAGLPAGAQEFGGRNLIVTDGRSDAGAAAPLVFVLHGLTGSGWIMQRKTGFDTLAAKHGFVVAYPNGIGRRWRTETGSVDVTYLAALIDRLTQSYASDPAQIYLVGYSNGGAMAIRMACALPARIAAIAVVAMTQPRGAPCPEMLPMPALFINGALDPVVPITGLAPSERFDGLFSLEETLGQWNRRNRCAGSAPAQVFDQVAGPDTARVRQFSGCAAPLTSVVLTGQGHDWPGAVPRLSFLLGPASREMDAAAFGWRFFSSIGAR